MYKTNETLSNQIKVQELTIAELEQQIEIGKQSQANLEKIISMQAEQIKALEAQLKIVTNAAHRFEQMNYELIENLEKRQNSVERIQSPE